MVREYIFLAGGCVSVGVVLTFIVLGVSQRLGINIDKNLWVVAIPAVYLFPQHNPSGTLPQVPEKKIKKEGVFTPSQLLS